jgi:hypothetical protein
MASHAAIVTFTFSTTSVSLPCMLYPTRRHVCVRTRSRFASDAAALLLSAALGYSNGALSVMVATLHRAAGPQARLRLQSGRGVSV